jgi:hypothetical protein
MSILKGLEEKHGVNNNSGGDNNRQSINLPVKITAYEEDKYFIGERIDTKEMVKVKLREDVSATGKNARPEVVDFQDRRSKRYAPPGDSILLFDNAYLGEDGVWISRWANTLHKKRKMEAKVLVLPATVRFVDDANKPYIQVRVIKGTKWIHTLEDLEYALTKALQPKGAGSRPFAHVRLKSSEGEERIYTVSPKMLETTMNEQQMKIPASGEESYQNFLEQEKNKLIIDCCSTPEITVEVLTGASLYLGGDTRDRFLSTAYLRNMIEPAYLIDKAGNKEISNYGYQKTVIAVREIEDVNGLMFVSDVKPLVNNTQAVSIMELQLDS